MPFFSCCLLLPTSSLSLTSATASVCLLCVLSVLRNLSDVFVSTVQLFITGTVLWLSRGASHCSFFVAVCSHQPPHSVLRVPLPLFVGCVLSVLKSLSHGLVSAVQLFVPAMYWLLTKSHCSSVLLLSALANLCTQSYECHCFSLSAVDAVCSHCFIRLCWL